MISQPVVSVIMGVYNERNRNALEDSIDSILTQTLRDIEFIIYNDGSDKSVTKHLLEITGWDEKKQLSNRDKRIVLAGKEENKGLAYSLNECISLARGKYIARMDADDISFCDRLEKQYTFLEAHAEYSWCGCSAQLFDKNGVWGTRHLPEKPTKNDYLKFSPFIHPTVMFRKCLFEERNGYLESEVTLRCEDYEIFMRLQEEGLCGYNMPEVLFAYREDKTSYNRRSMKNRINETRIRYEYFQRLGILSPMRFLYVIRPLIGGLIPSGLIEYVKKSEGRKDDRRYSRKPQEYIPEYSEQRSGVVLGTEGFVQIRPQ